MLCTISVFTYTDCTHTHTYATLTLYSFALPNTKADTVKGTLSGVFTFKENIYKKNLTFMLTVTKITSHFPHSVWITSGR